MISVRLPDKPIQSNTLLYRILYGCAFRDSFLDGLLCTGVLSDHPKCKRFKPGSQLENETFFGADYRVCIRC